MLIPKIEPRFEDHRCWTCRNNRWKFIEWRNGVVDEKGVHFRYDVFRWNGFHDAWLMKPFMTQDKAINILTRDDRIRVMLDTL